MLIGFVNGRVYTSFIPKRVVEAFAVLGNKVVFVGESKAVEKLVSLFGGETIDLHGKTVLPGFIDAHIHLDSLGIELNTLDLRGVRSIEELKRVLREYSSRCRMRWVIGRGWDHEMFAEKRYPTRWDIDEAVNDKPVYLSRVCGHVAVLNSVALEKTGLLYSKSPNVLRSESGEATGVVIEDAAWVAWQKVLDDIPSEDYEKMLLDAINHLLSHGVTTAGFVSCDLRAFKALASLRSKNLLRIRVRLYTDLNLFKALKDLGIKAPFGDDYLRVVGLKLFADGSLGARTAWLSKPYADDSSTSGKPSIDRRELESIALEAKSHGFQLAVHAIGDRALDMVLDVYKAVGGERNRVEHASIIRDDQIDVFKQVKAVAVVQPHFILSDWWVVKRVGAERAKWVYRFRDLIENGVPVAFSTDSPVEPVNPWETIYAAVSRGRHEGIELYRYTEDQKLTVGEALHLYTYGSAYALNEESAIGRLDVGMYADFIVVDKDPFEVGDEEIKKIRVLETWVNGSRVYP